MMDTWRIETVVSEKTAETMELALEPFCVAVSRFLLEEDGPDWRVEGYSNNEPDIKVLSAVLGLQASQIQIERLSGRDWVGENLASFPPLEVGRYFIFPTHYKNKIPSGKVNLCLNAGAAFGSGEHASTRGCLLALGWLARQRRFTSVLDLGCGSGILSMAVSGIWKIPVLATDIDSKSLAVAHENIRRNQMARLIKVSLSNGYRSSFIRRKMPFDLIVCNILANPLCKMAVDLGRNLDRQRGMAVLSGFLERDANRVLAAHRFQGLRLLCRFHVDGWQTLVIGR